MSAFSQSSIKSSVNSLIACRSIILFCSSETFGAIFLRCFIFLMRFGLLFLLGAVANITITLLSFIRILVRLPMRLMLTKLYHIRLRIAIMGSYVCYHKDCLHTPSDIISLAERGVCRRACVGEQVVAALTLKQMTFDQLAAHAPHLGFVPF